MRGPLLLSGGAHGVVALLLLAGAALWPAARPAIPPVLAEVELVVQDTAAVGPKPHAGAPARLPSELPISSGTAPALVATPAVAPRVAAPLPLPPRWVPQPAPRARAARPTSTPAPAVSARTAPTERVARPAPGTAATPDGSSGVGRARGPGIIPAAIDAAARNEPPQYPPGAVRRGEQGVVLLAIAVAPDGAASTVSVVKSSGYAVLDRAARKAVAAWHFIAARRGGTAVPSTMQLRVRFVLKDATTDAP